MTRHVLWNAEWLLQSGWHVQRHNPSSSHQAHKCPHNKQARAHVHTYVHTYSYSTLHCIAIECTTIQCNTIQSNTVQYTIQYTVQYAIQYTTLHYNTIQYNTYIYLHSSVYTAVISSWLLVTHRSQLSNPRMPFHDPRNFPRASMYEDFMMVHDAPDEGKHVQRCQRCQKCQKFPC